MCDKILWAWFHCSFDDCATYPVINDEALVCCSRTATIISVYVQKDHQVSVSKELFMLKKEYVKHFISLLSRHYAVVDANHRQGGHFVESSTESSIVVNAKGFLFVYFTRLQIMQMIYSQCSTSPNKLNGQREDESGQSMIYSTVLEGDCVKGHYSLYISQV